MTFKSMPNLSERLKYVRKLHNLSQVELAALARTTQQAIQQAEAGKARNPRYLHEIARALELDVNWLVFGEEVRETSANQSQQNTGFEEEVMGVFRGMPEEEQKLMYELMKSRQKNDAGKK